MKENVVSGFLGQGVWKVQLAEVYRHLGEPICDFRPIFFRRLAQDMYG